MSTLPVYARKLLLSIFVISGFTGLIYESIWTQYLKLFLGHAAYAQTLVLVIFMGGLALGSAIVARFSDRIRSLLWGYLLVEGAIGIAGIVFHRVFIRASDFSFMTVIPALPAGLSIDIYKWFLGGLLILPQSVLLGMTFPLISGGLVRYQPERTGRTLSMLYFTNSLGAATGVLVSGYVLIGAVGLPGTVLTAGLLNLALALVVWSVVRRREEPRPASGRGLVSPLASDGLARWFVMAAFLTGVASFMYELGWIRMLSLVLGSSTHSFELMLSAFILGLALGGFFIRKHVDSIRNPERFLAGVMLAMGSLAALTLPLYNQMFDFMAWALQTLTHTPGGWVAFNLAGQSISILIMLPATVCAGMTLPVLTHALMRRGRSEEGIGTIYAVNTLGCIVGVLLTVHLLMPQVGIKGVILAGATIHIALGLSRLISLRERPLAIRAAAAASVLLLATIAAFGTLDPTRLASGVFRTAKPTIGPGFVVKYLRHGKTATVSLAEQEGHVVIATNGKPDASIQMGPGAPTVDELTQVLLAAIPLSLHPDATRIADVGFGSGMTAHTLLTSPRLKQLDTIEIEPFMVQAARLGFGPRIHDVFEDPRSHVIFEDAKTFFASSHGKYDLIVSEPSNPWVSGVASLFSEEFYQRASNYLAADGYLAQWVQLYETDISVFASIVKALSAHFPHYAIYNLDDIDVLIVATPGSGLSTLDEQIFRWPNMRAELKHIGVNSLEDLGFRKIGDDQTLGALLNALPVPRNSDFFPYVDLNAGRLRFLQADALDLPQLTVLPLPFLGLIQPMAAPDRTPPPAATSTLARDQRVRQALALRSALMSGSMAGVSARSADDLVLLNMSVELCADPFAQHLWRLAARQISDLTSPYLAPIELRDVWKQIRSTACFQRIAGNDRSWIELFAALADRRSSDIATLGSKLLNDDASASPDERSYLATATAAALMELGRAPDAAHLLDSLGPSVITHGYEVPLGELAILSHVARHSRDSIAQLSGMPGQ
jgi:predicted membrane-bound spermidine synthase